MIERTELVEGSGGGGAQAGGRGHAARLPAARRRRRGHVLRRADAGRVRGRGPCGWGRRAGTAKVLLRRAATGDWEELPGKGFLKLSRGDVISFIGAGGGGYGAENG